MADMMFSSTDSPGYSRAGAVFSVPELFENIMLRLDQRTLLTVALITCRQWNDFITRSSVLQQHLFLEPRADVFPRVMNHLLVERFPDWFPSADDHFPGRRPVTREELQRWLPRLWDRKIKAMMYEHASWRRMLPCQPPLYSFIRCTCRRGNAPKNQLMTLTQPDPDDVIYERMPAIGEEWRREYTAEEIVPELPITMDKMYNIVTMGSSSGGGLENQWLFEWSRGDGTLSDCLQDDVHGELRDLLQQSLKWDGLLFFEWTSSGHWDEDEDVVFWALGLEPQYEVDDCLSLRWYRKHEVYGRRRLRPWHMGYWTWTSRGVDPPPLGSRIVSTIDEQWL